MDFCAEGRGVNVYQMPYRKPLIYQELNVKVCSDLAPCFTVKSIACDNVFLYIKKGYHKQINYTLLSKNKQSQQG